MVLGLKTLRKKLVEAHRKSKAEIEKDNELAEEKRQKRELERVKEKKKQAIKDKKDKIKQDIEKKKQIIKHNQSKVFYVKLYSIEHNMIRICEKVNYVTALEWYNKIKEQIKDDTTKIIEYEHNNGKPACIMKEMYKIYMLTINDWY